MSGLWWTWVDFPCLPLCRKCICWILGLMLWVHWIHRTDMSVLSGFPTFPSHSFFNLCLTQLEAFDALNLNQIAEIITEDLPELPDKKQLIDIVFSNILSSPTMRHNLPQLILIISEMNMVQKLSVLLIRSCVFVTCPDFIWFYNINARLYDDT